MDSVYRLVIHRPRLVLFLILLPSPVFFAFHARHIQIDSSLDSLLPDNDPERQYYNDVVRLFGSENVAVIGILADNIYTPQTLQKIQRLTDEFRKIPEVKNAFSLTNAPDIIAKVIGAEQELLVPTIPATVEEAATIKEKVATQPIYHKNLVAADGRAAAINIFFLESITDNEFVRRGIDEKIQAIIDQAQGPEQIYYTGLPHFKAVSARAIVEDLSYLLPLALVLILVVLFFCLRSVRGVMLPALTVIITVIWTLGTHGAWWQSSEPRHAVVTTDVTRPRGRLLSPRGC